MSPPLRKLLDVFSNVTLVDTEFRAIRGNLPEPICMVTKDLRTGFIRKYWQDDLRKFKDCPFPAGPSDLMAAFYASAEVGSILAFGWKPPENIIDLYAEHRVETSGLSLAAGNGLLGALAHRGLTRIDVSVKDAMRDRIIGQTAWSAAERAEILDYCESDVQALQPLLYAMETTLDIPRALIRGRYMAAVARMERVGIPIDLDLHEALIESWEITRWRLVADMDQEFGVYDGLRFKTGRFSELLRRRKIPWPRSEHGVLKLDDETFKEQVSIWPELTPLRDLRQALGRMYLADLQIGVDGRSRTLLSPFASKTGRNQPSAKRFAFGPPAWQRGVIKPPEGWGLSYIDFSSQEIGIAAGLSGDERLIDAYMAGDPYLYFAKQIGAAPPDATRDSHPAVRAICKEIVLGLNYGLGAERMALRAGISPASATELIERHRQTYKRFWRWSEDTVTSSLLTNQMHSIFGWRRRLNATDRATSLMNFPMQANGAEMMRIAAIAATEAGIQVCAPVHDAFLIASPLERLDSDVRAMQEIMTSAGAVVTGGIPIRTEAKVLRFPQRYMEARGLAMWNRVVNLIDRHDAVCHSPTIA
jgi:hypothetical protein